MVQRGPKEYYSRKAGIEGYLARSAFKLKSADEKYGLFRSGDAVLDLGCNPGSWSQYALQRIGKKGRLVGVDRKQPQRLPTAVHFIEGDVFSLSPDTIRSVCPAFDVVMSDMAPDTMGDRFVDGVRSYNLSKRALETALELLKPGGKFICKIFQSGEFELFLKEVRSAFGLTRVFKPPSSRKQSRETFVVGIDRLSG
jgi:23S rRNA (uridine2552-2'-O)-methyltransferase